MSFVDSLLIELTKFLPKIIKITDNQRSVPITLCNDNIMICRYDNNKLKLVLNEYLLFVGFQKLFQVYSEEELKYSIITNKNTTKI